jgi:glycosyltransferase involved in cell wall biosynthesis
MFNLGLTRALPKPIRDWVKSTVGRAVHSENRIRLSARPYRAYTGQRVGVAGLFSISCGLQRAADLMVLDLQARGCAVVRIDLTPLAGPDRDIVRTDTIEVFSVHAARVDDLVVHAPPPIVGAFLNALGQRAYDRHCVVAFWHWETQRAPDFWRESADMMDEIWAPTPFVRDALALMNPEAVERIRVVPNAIEADRIPTTSIETRRAARSQFKIAENDFVAGFSFSMKSGFTRKNPLAALDAFELAFPPNVINARFILRCLDAWAYPNGHDALRQRAQRDSRIILLDGTKPIGSIFEFYSALDTLVSLHRSEGYGLIIAEASQSGAATIATGWGLAPELVEMPRVRCVDFALIPICDSQGIYSSANGDLWAEPNVEQAARLLRADKAALVNHTP